MLLDGLVKKCLDYASTLEHIMDFTRRDCLKTVAATSIAPMAASTVLAAPKGPTLEGVNWGQFVTGTKLKKSDLKGKPIVFEYWGDRCAPCLAAIKHLCELQKFDFFFKKLRK